jgi:hypothetical protein
MTGGKRKVRHFGHRWTLCRGWKLIFALLDESQPYIINKSPSCVRWWRGCCSLKADSGTVRRTNRRGASDAARNWDDFKTGFSVKHSQLEDLGLVSHRLRQRIPRAGQAKASGLEDGTAQSGQGVLRCMSSRDTEITDCFITLCLLRLPYCPGGQHLIPPSVDEPRHLQYLAPLCRHQLPGDHGAL